jgi:hypothetical protein
MNTDELMLSLAEIAREEQEGCDRDTEDRSTEDRNSGISPELPWEALAEGHLDQEQKETLRRAAEESATAMAAYEAFRPLGPDFEARMQAAVAPHLPKALPEDAIEDQVGLGEIPDSPAVGRDSNPLPFRQRERKKLHWLPMVAGLAACLLFFLWPRGMEWAPLPSYTAKISGGVQTMRDLSTTQQKSVGYSRQGQLEALLRPEIATTGTVVARAYLGTPKGIEILPFEPEVSEQGAIRLRIAISSLLPFDLDSATLYLAAGRPDSLPSASEVADLPSGKETWSVDTWYLAAYPIKIKEPPTTP